MRIPKNIKASTLVLVLVILFVASLLLFFTMSALVSQTKQVKVEREKDKSELFAESALDVLSKKFAEDPEDFVTNYVNGDTKSVPLSSNNGLGICDENADDINKKCGDQSHVLIRKLKYIYSFKLKHDETLQVTLAKKDQNATASDIEIEFTDPTADNHQQRYLVTAYYYVHPNMPTRALRVAGSCTITFNQSSTSVSCLGDIHNSVLSVPDDKKDYGEKRVRLSFVNNKPHFVRIKAIYSNINKYTWVSVTGKNYSDLPLEQMLVFDSHVYTTDANNETLHSHLVKTIVFNPQMPEIMDWVFFNGSNQSVVK